MASNLRIYARNLINKIRPEEVEFDYKYEYESVRNRGLAAAGITALLITLYAACCQPLISYDNMHNYSTAKIESAASDLAHYALF